MLVWVFAAELFLLLQLQLGPGGSSLNEAENILISYCVKQEGLKNAHKPA